MSALPSPSKALPPGGTWYNAEATSTNVDNVADPTPIHSQYIVPPPHAHPESRPTVMGLRQENNYPTNIYHDDYEIRFPEDPIYEETAPKARIWRVYDEEMAALDTHRVGQSRDGLDVMLVFAGLFSAVVTSFLVQVSQNLRPDFGEISTALLYQILLQQAISNGEQIANASISLSNPVDDFNPSRIDVWINGLWVVSLTTSLVVALAAVLIKQWLHHYTSFPSGTPRLRSHIRHYRYIGLQKWRVETIIGALPILMNISLTLFLVGLVLYFVPLRLSLACTLGILTGTVTFVYFICNTLPIFFPQCPYQTHFTNVIIYASMNVARVYHRALYAANNLKTDGTRYLQSCFGWPLSVSHPTSFSYQPPMSFVQREIFEVEQHGHTLTVDALSFLFMESSHPSIKSLVAQSMGSLTKESYDYLKDLPSRDFTSALFEMLIPKIYAWPDPVQWMRRPGNRGITERFCRTLTMLAHIEMDHYRRVFSNLKVIHYLEVKHVSDFAIDIGHDVALAGALWSVAALYCPHDNFPWDAFARFVIQCHNKGSRLPPLLWARILEGIMPEWRLPHMLPELLDIMVEITQEWQPVIPRGPTTISMSVMSFNHLACHIRQYTLKSILLRAQSSNEDLPALRSTLLKYLDNEPLPTNDTISILQSPLIMQCLPPSGDMVAVMDHLCMIFKPRITFQPVLWKAQSQVIRVLLPYWCSKYGDILEVLHVITQTLYQAIWHGDENASQIFIENDLWGCMISTSPHHFIRPPLSSKISAAFINYMYTSDNLMRIKITHGRLPYYRDEEFLSDHSFTPHDILDYLFTLRPDSPSWHDLVQNTKQLLRWVEGDQQEPFPLSNTFLDRHPIVRKVLRDDITKDLGDEWQKYIEKLEQKLANRGTL